MRYERPYGWFRIALNIDGKYPEDGWLTIGDPREWAVAYHGTRVENLESIVRYSLQPGGTNGVRVANGSVYGPGIYLTPDHNVAAQFSPPFHQDDDLYQVCLFLDSVFILAQVVIQVRVKPGHGDPTRGYVVHSANNWLAKDPAIVRPYGVLIRQIEPDSLVGLFLLVVCSSCLCSGS